jgi:hypothetical protein
MVLLEEHTVTCVLQVSLAIFIEKLLILCGIFFAFCNTVNFETIYNKKCRQNLSHAETLLNQLLIFLRRF